MAPARGLHTVRMRLCQLQPWPGIPPRRCLSKICESSGADSIQRSSVAVSAVVRMRNGSLHGGAASGTTVLCPGYRRDIRPLAYTRRSQLPVGFAFPRIAGSPPSLPLSNLPDHRKTNASFLPRPFTQSRLHCLCAHDAVSTEAVPQTIAIAAGRSTRCVQSIIALPRSEYPSTTRISLGQPRVEAHHPNDSLGIVTAIGGDGAMPSSLAGDRALKALVHHFSCGQTRCLHCCTEPCSRV
jgi:hypothetical protein